MLYIFKDKSDNRFVYNEQQAHNQIRNLGQWQRQDLAYLGVVKKEGADISRLNQERRERANKLIIEQDNDYKTLHLRLEVAELKKDEAEVKLCNAEIRLLESDILSRLRATDALTLLQEKTLKQYTEILNRLEKEDIESWEVDANIMPRNLSGSTQRLSGKEIGID